MKASLIGFEKALSDLRQHIAFLESEKKVFGLAAGSTGGTAVEIALAALVGQAGLSGAKKQFDYNGIVVALYGCLEQYLEGLLKGYLQKLSEHSSDYSTIPDAVRDNHIEVTVTLLKGPDLQKYRGVITPENLTANLHSCLSNQKPFFLNIEAFSHHTANFRVANADQFFSRVGIKNLSSRATQVLSFQTFISAYDPNRPKGSPDCLAEIDDLAERRNEVAHGSSSQLLSNELLLNYVSIVEAYGKALYEVVRSEALAFEFSHSVPVQLGQTVAVYNHSIICIEVPSQTTIHLGDRLVTLKDTGICNAIGGEILKMQLNNQDIGSCSFLAPTNIGFEVGFRAKDDQEFFVLPREV